VAPVVELWHLSKRFGALNAVDDVSLTVAAGEVVALLGPNGAGKTTTISLMLGLLQPSHGNARIFGLAPRDRKARSRRGVMLQDAGAPPALTVSELLDLFRGYYPKPRPAHELLKAIGLEEQANTRVSKLSGGQRQRLHFGLALCGDPEVLFLDEPTVGLDVEGRRALWAEVSDVAARGRTVLLTTHYLEEADALASRVVVINHGRIIADAPPSLIKAQVPTKRVSFELLADCALPNLEQSQRVEQIGRRVSVFSHTPEAVLSTLFEQRIAIRDLHVEGARLEEALLALLGTRATSHA
jgi:ABC-2 type transport system ATP-binding protein